MTIIDIVELEIGGKKQYSSISLTEMAPALL